MDTASADGQALTSACKKEARAQSVSRSHVDNVASGQWPALTLTGVSLADQSNHQRGAVAALSGAGEGLDAELMGFGLKKNTKKKVRQPRSQDKVGHSAFCLEKVAACHFSLDTYP